MIINRKFEAVLKGKILKSVISVDILLMAMCHSVLQFSNSILHLSFQVPLPNLVPGSNICALRSEVAYFWDVCQPVLFVP